MAEEGAQRTAMLAMSARHMRFRNTKRTVACKHVAMLARAAFCASTTRIAQSVLRAVQFGEHTEAARRAQRQQQEAMAAAQQRRRMAAMVVPTDDKDVRSWLRKLSEPMTLFGERAMERRERLRALMAKLPEDRRDALTEELMRLEVENRVAPQEKFYTEGPPELARLRRCGACLCAW